MPKCRACERERSAGDFCPYHAIAHTSLRNGYEKWRHAYGDISWREYLRRLLKREETGSWVKDIIMLELKQEE